MTAVKLNPKSLNQTKVFLTLLLGVILPFDVPAIYILPLLSLFLTVVIREENLSLKSLRISKNGFFLTVLFAIHLMWFAPTILKSNSFSYLEKMLPLLLFPLMISSTRIDKQKLRTILAWFIYALVCSYMLSLLVAVYNYFYSVPRWGRASDFFFHEQFTSGLFNIHPTYYGLLGCLATLFAFQFSTKWYRFLIVFILTVFIVLINARITLLIQILLILSFLVKYLSQGVTGRKLLITGVFILVMLSLIQITNSIYDYPHRKMLLDLKASWTRSYASDISEGDGGLVTRFAIWRGAIEVIKNNPLLGVGLDNEKEYLASEFKKNDITYLIQFPNNAHNHLLSYLIGMGVLGVILLALFFFIVLREPYSKKCWFYFEILAIFLIVGMTESLFNRDLGISIFAYFYTLLFLKYVKDDQ